ncbi:MAG: hypothetical protein E6I94_02550 [Chloroflexi bacterium]|nr:MAG: hypothetical protein E6I94_02550 [Chloroflexota bacterium]
MTTEVPADIAIEPIYVIEATYGPRAAELRPSVRPEHLSRILDLRDRGIVIEAGGYTDFSTAIIFLRAASEAEALAIARDDIYLRSGVWVDVRVKPFGRVVRPKELPGPTPG